MVTSDKIKVLIRVMINGKVMVRNFADSTAEVFPDLEAANKHIGKLLEEAEKEQDVS